MLDRKKAFILFVDYLFITLGCVVFTLGWSIFMIPYNMSSGGLTGACVIINFGLGIPVSVSYFVLNVVLLILGVIVLGNGFGIKTIYGIVLCSVLFELWPKVGFENVEWLHIDEVIMRPIFGGLMEAFGLSCMFRHGGSSGGTDIIALIVNKYWPISPGTTYLVTDLAIISSMLILPGKGLQDLAYGYVMMITFSLAIDAFTYGNKTAVQVMIFSLKYKEIADVINNVMQRGVTALNGVGWYTKEERKVLVIYIRKNQINALTKVIKDIDPRAFVCVSPANSVFGEGFEEMKTGITRRKKGKADAAATVDETDALTI